MYFYNEEIDFSHSKNLFKRNILKYAIQLEASKPKWVNSILFSQRGTSDSVTDSSVLSNPVDAQNVSCLGLCGRDICPKSSA